MVRVLKIGEGGDYEKLGEWDSALETQVVALV